MAAARAFFVQELGEAQAFAAAEEWRPTVCFSHNMNALAIEAGLVSRWPVVKMMHGYFGTCVSGQKCSSFRIASRATGGWAPPVSRSISRAAAASAVPR